jgi:hypothetical protein
VACLLKAPDGALKGCVVFTTQERDHVINKSVELRCRLQALKQRYVIGLHHNWHDHQFHYDPLFDFSMAGDGDLIEADGRDFARIPVDACNFAPPCYSAPRGEQLWDILYVARAVAFKGIPEFFQTIRTLYDRRLTPRVLFICALPEEVEIPGIADLRVHFEALFSVAERQRVTFLTLDWDYPFPLDAESLAFFYRSSRIFFHPAPDERRCRTAAYAWAGGMSVVCGGNVASILPQRFHTGPFLFSFEDSKAAPEALAAALAEAGLPDAKWPNVAAEFSASASSLRLAGMLDALAARYGWGEVAKTPINPSRLDIRLGRHHGISIGANRVDFTVAELCQALSAMADEDIESACTTPDPELRLRDAWHLRPSARKTAAGLLQKIGLLRT